MQVKVNKLPKATIKIDITVPVEEVKKTYEEVMVTVVKDAEIKGFRKGQAPREMVEEKTDPSKLYGEIINELLRKFYPQALKENKINPISNPKVEIEDFDLEKDFKFSAEVATRPEIKLGDYKKAIKKHYEEKQAELHKENEEKLRKGENITHDHVHLNPGEIVDVVAKVTEVEIADILVEEEADRITSRLVNQAQAVGLSLDQYLKSQNKTAEELREEHKKLAEGTLKQEFVLSELVTKEGVVASDEDILATAKATGNLDAEKSLEDPLNKFYIKSVLEKNMVINKLIEEAQGKDHDETSGDAAEKTSQKDKEKKEEK